MEPTVKCPNCFQQVAKKNHYCLFCGYDLSGVPSEPEPDSVASGGFPRISIDYASRTCKCGYVCDDPELNFCPACGLPLKSVPASDDSGWRCVCGAMNRSDMHFCCTCGKPKDWKPSEPEPEPARPEKKVSIPAGMKAPDDGDLAVKYKYGN